MSARYEDGTPISRKDLATELIILLAGGYETVVASLSWTLALLSGNPGPRQLLVDEVNELRYRTLGFDDLERLSWTKACFDEGQRLQGHPFHPRFAMVDDVIGGYRIPRGTLVGVSMHSLHRDPRWWGSEPDAYDPNRFYDKDIVAARPNLAFIPFGAGPHRCIGSALAYMNAQFLLALIYQRYELHTPPGWTPRHASTFSVTLRGGLPVTLTHAVAAARKAQ
jgi:cytochrome P450